MRIEVYHTDIRVCLSLRVLDKTQQKQRGEAVLELGLCAGLEMQAILCAGKQIYGGGSREEQGEDRLSESIQEGSGVMYLCSLCLHGFICASTGIFPTFKAF